MGHGVKVATRPEQLDSVLRGIALVDDPRSRPAGDTDYTAERLVTTANEDLAKNIGNLVTAPSRWSSATEVAPSLPSPTTTPTPSATGAPARRS
jgi:hypothetical protein